MIKIKDINFTKNKIELNSWFNYYKKNNNFEFDKLEKYIGHKGIYINNKLSAYMLWDINDSCLDKSCLDKDDIIEFDYLLFNPEEDSIKVLKELINYFQDKNEYAIGFSSLMENREWFDNIMTELNAFKIPCYTDDNSIRTRYFIILTKTKDEEIYKLDLSLKIYNHNEYPFNLTLLKEHNTKCYIFTKKEYQENFKIPYRYLMFKEPLVIKHPWSEDKVDKKKLSQDDIYFDLEINSKIYGQINNLESVKISDFENYHTYKRLNKLNYLYKYSLFVYVIYGIKIHRDCSNKKKYIHPVKEYFSTWLNDNFKDTTKIRKKEGNIIFKILHKKSIVPNLEIYNDLYLDILFDDTIYNSIKTQKSKKNIPKRLKDLLWQTYFGKQYQSKCSVPRCNTTIFCNDFHTGHKISEKNGGETKLDNLIPLCSQCNLSMNFSNYDEWIRRWGLD